MKLVSRNPEDTRAIAAKLAQRVRAAMPGAQATVIALRGELGAGKTTFVQGFADAIGVVQTPKSPTFTLMKSYAVPSTPYSVWHLDCYRLKGREDLTTLDMHLVLSDPRNIVLVEWPERIGDGLPRNHIEVHMTHAGADSRGIDISE
jgi:tRNA threonylcarbamoyladenosine biosynthesis protein TsaE